MGRSSFRDSYDGFNIDYEESRGRFMESLEIIQKAWADEPFSYKGEYYTVNNVSVVPMPRWPSPEAVTMSAWSR